MQKFVPQALAELALLGGSLLLAPAAFATSTWDMSGNAGTGCTQSATNKDNFGNSWSCTSSGAPTVKGAAYSTTGTGASFAAANLALWTGNGFGVQNAVEGLNAGSPNHSLDNGGNTDVMLLSFTSAVALSSVSIGWSQTDSDISVLRYTGATVPTILGATTPSLLTSGWQLVGNYANVTGVTSASTGNPTGVTSVNSTNLASSWWLISAYNAGYGASAGDPRSATTGLDAGNDYIKVLAVAGTPATTTRVPEPASVPLVALAFAAMAWVSRRSIAGRSDSTTRA